MWTYSLTPPWSDHPRHLLTAGVNRVLLMLTMPTCNMSCVCSWIFFFTFIILVVEMVNQALTSSIFEAQIGKSPNISQTNNSSDYWQNELALVGPLASFIVLWWSTVSTGVIFHQILLLIFCLLHQPLLVKQEKKNSSDEIWKTICPVQQMLCFNSMHSFSALTHEQWRHGYILTGRLCWNVHICCSFQGLQRQQRIPCLKSLW